MYLLGLPLETLHSILDFCVGEVTGGLSDASALRLVCKLLAEETIYAICRTRGPHNSTSFTHHNIPWKNKRLVEEYVYGWIQSPRNRQNPVTAAFRYAIAFVIQENGEQADDALQRYYTRRLCLTATGPASRQLGSVLHSSSDLSSPKHDGLGEPIDAALAASAYLNMPDSVRKLIAQGAKDSWTYLGYPFVCAAGQGNVDVVSILLDADIVRWRSWTAALEPAARNGHIRVLKLLLERPLGTVQFVDYCFFIKVAAIGGHIEMLDLLMAEESFPVDKDSVINPRLPPYLNAKQYPEEFWWERILTGACEGGQLSLVRKALDRGTDPALRFPKIPKPGLLTTAASGGWFDVISLLLSQPELQLGGNFLNDLDQALYEAAGGGWLRVAKLLVKNGAHINPREKEVEDVKTAWAHATRRGQADMLQYLLDQGADCSIGREYGDRAIEHARRLGYTSILRILEVNGVC